MAARAYPTGLAASTLGRVTTVAVEPAEQPDVEALLGEGERYALSLYPPDSCYLLDVRELAAPGVTVWVARSDGGSALGMVALVEARDGTAEIKRLFVRDEARGLGCATLLMDALEQHARDRGVARILLETGPKQHAAIALYERRGYERIENFGPYVGDDFSYCMARELDAAR
jgi:putative acetyltransferase